MSRVAAGRAAKKAGDNFEAFVEAQHEAAQWLGVLLTWQHNQPQAKYVGGRLTYVAKSGTDYTGLVVEGSGHQMLAVEAKSTKKRLMRSAVKPKQTEQLDAVAKAGHSAWLLVEFRVGAWGFVRFAIPWLSVPWRKVKSAYSIGPGDDGMKLEWQISLGECYLKRGVQVPVGVGGRKRVFPRE